MSANRRFKYEISGADGCKGCKSDKLTNLCPKCQEKARQLEASKAPKALLAPNVSGSKANKSAIKSNVISDKSNNPVTLKGKEPKANKMLTYEQRQANARANEEKDRQRNARFIASVEAKTPTVSSSHSNNTPANPSNTHTHTAPALTISQMPQPVATLNMTVAETNNLYKLIDARVEVRLAALRALPIKMADPLGVNAQLSAAKERNDRERFRQEEISKAFAPLQAQLAASGAARKPYMCDPLGLRAHGLNPDGTPYLGDVNDSNPFHKPASDRLNLNVDNPGKGTR